MNKAINVGIIIILIVASFFIGYTLKVPESSSSEIISLQGQISDLQQQNSQIQNSLQQKDILIESLNNQIEELKNQLEESTPSQKQNFQYTHIYGQNYTFSTEGNTYPLSDDAKCSLINQGLNLAPNDWTCDCDRLKLHESNWYLDCGIGCVGFNIDEENKIITSITTCTTN